MALTQKIIEYMDQGSFYTALVLEDSGNKRLRILNQKGREANLPLSRVIHQTSQRIKVGDTRNERIKLVEDTFARRKELVSSVNLLELWEVVKEEAGNLLKISFVAELCFGTEPNDDQMAAFLRAVFDDKLFFKFKDHKLLVHSEEVVEQLQLRSRKEEDKNRLLQKGSLALRDLWEGKPVDDWEDRDKCLELIKQYSIYGKDAEESDIAQQLLKNAGLTAPHIGYKLLVKLGIWQKHENIAIYRQELPRSFDTVSMAAISDLPDCPGEDFLASGYKDLRELPLVTIDGPLTKDHDDAIHILQKGKDFEIGVHIANVAAYLPPNSPLFKTAQQRVTSAYFADDYIPMLPSALSEGICSLFAGKERLAISFLATISAQGEILESKIVPSIIQVKRQLTYEQVDSLIDKDKELANFYTMGQILQKRRIENGALILPFPDVLLDFQDNEPVTVRLADVDTPGRMLVAEFMVFANSLAAQYLAERAVPCLYRSQGKAGQRIVKEPTKDLVTNLRQRRHLSPGKLGTEPVAHSGVGVAQYTTVTSPIRRFLDLVVQHQLLHQLMGKGVLFRDDQLTDFGAVINHQQSKVNLVRQKRHRYWLLCYLERFVGQRLNALIVAKGPRRVQVVLPNFMLEADLPPNQGILAKAGDTVKLKLAKINALDNTFRLEW